MRVQALPLSTLTPQEVICLLKNTNLSHYAETALIREINGRKLSKCKNVKTLERLLSMNEAEAKSLMECITKFAKHGVSAKLLEQQGIN